MLIRRGVEILHVRYVSTVSATQLKTLFLTVSVGSAAQLKPSDAAAEPRSAGCGQQRETITTVTTSHLGDLGRGGHLVGNLAGRRRRG